MVRRASVCALVLCGATCVRVEAYTCSRDDECLQSDGGLCEPTSYCSYPDPDCDSMRRYSGLAGPYAGECTDPLVDATDTDLTTSSSTSSSTTSSNSSSEGPERITGDTGTPVVHGEVVWSFLHAGDGGGSDVFWGVEAVGDAEFVVAGYEHMLVGGRNVLITRYNAPDEVVWHVSRDADGGTDQAMTLVRWDDGALYLSGRHAIDGTSHAFVGRWEIDEGDESWVESTVGFEADDVAVTSNGIVVSAGTVGSTSAFASAWFTYDLEVWEHTLPATSDVRLAAAAAFDQDVYVGGELDNEVYFARVDSVGFHPLVLRSQFPQLGIQAIVPTADAIFVAGYRSTIDAGEDAWLARLSFAGAIEWEGSPSGEFNDEFESLVIGNEGELFLVGFSGGVEDPDVLVAEWTEDGEEVWSRSYPELDQGDAHGRDIAVTPSGELLVVGQAEGPAGDIDALAARIVP